MGVNEWGCTQNLAAYQQYIIQPCYEGGGFLLYDYSNLTEPTYIGSLSPSWHAYNARVVGHYGFLGGDTKSVIVDLEENITSPLTIWDTSWYREVWAGYDYQFSYQPAISEEYIIFTSASTGNPDVKRRFDILPCEENTRTYGNSTTISIAKGTDYLDCVMIQDDIVLVSRNENTLTVIAITAEMELANLGEISLGDGGEVRHIYPGSDLKTIYIADGAKGLYVLKIHREFQVPIRTSMSTSSERIPGWEWSILLIGISILVHFQRKGLKW